MPDLQGFPYWGMGGVSPHKPKIHSFPHLEKSQVESPPTKLLFPPHQKSVPPLNKSFQDITQ